MLLYENLLLENSLLLLHSLDILPNLDAIEEFVINPAEDEEPPPRNVVVTLSTEDSYISFLAEWDHPELGHPGHYEIVINYTLNSNNFTIKRNVTGISRSYLAIFAAGTTFTDFRIAAFAANRLSSQVLIPRSEFITGEGQQSPPSDPPLIIDGIFEIDADGYLEIDVDGYSEIGEPESDG